MELPCNASFPSTSTSVLPPSHISSSSSTPSPMPCATPAGKGLSSHLKVSARNADYPNQQLAARVADLSSNISISPKCKSTVAPLSPLAIPFDLSPSHTFAATCSPSFSRAPSHISSTSFSSPSSTRAPLCAYWGTPARLRLPGWLDRPPAA